MEQVLFRLHVRLLTTSNRYLGQRFRHILELTVLGAAFSSLMMLILLHTTYISSSTGTQHWNCLDAHLFKFNNFDNNITMRDVASSLRQFDLLKIRISNNAAENLHLRTTTVDDEDIDSVVSQNSRLFMFSFERGLLMLSNKIKAQHNFTRLTIDLDHNDGCFGPEPLSWLLRNYVGYDIAVINWALTAFNGRGFLFNANNKELFNLNFAGDFESKKGVSLVERGRSLHHHLTDSQSWLTRAVSSLRAAAGLPSEESSRGAFEPPSVAPESQPPRGRFLSPAGAATSGVISRSGQFLAFRLGLLCSTLFLFVVTTTLVSYTLRETQERMLRFTFLLQHHVAHRLPIASLVLTHVLESLVFVPIMMGIYFFLFEFFSDQLLAFLVILLVWMGEIFSVLSCRCRASVRFFPKIFCCYFSLFHSYFFVFPFGFAYAALLTAGLFKLHAMMHFWNRYEVPAFAAGAVSSETPRAGLLVSSNILSGQNVAYRQTDGQPAVAVSPAAQRQQVAPVAPNEAERSRTTVEAPAATAVPSIYESLQSRKIRLAKENRGVAAAGRDTRFDSGRGSVLPSEEECAVAVAGRSAVLSFRGRSSSESFSGRGMESSGLREGDAARASRGIGHRGGSRFTVFGDVGDE